MEAPHRRGADSYSLKDRAFSTAPLCGLDPAGSEYAQVADRLHSAEGEFRARDGFTIEAYRAATSYESIFTRTCCVRPAQYTVGNVCACPQNIRAL